VIIQDFIIPIYQKPLAEKKQLQLAKFISVGIGFLIVPISLVIGNIQGNLLEVTYKTVNLLVGPLFVPFFMARFVRRAQPGGTFIGTLLSGLVAIFISFSRELFGLSISFLWNIPGSFFAGLLVSWLLSRVLRD
jgi:SSS family solute:Na+ symporter